MPNLYLACIETNKSKWVFNELAYTHRINKMLRIFFYFICLWIRRHLFTLSWSIHVNTGRFYNHNISTYKLIFFSCLFHPHVNLNWFRSFLNYVNNLLTIWKLIKEIWRYLVCNNNARAYWIILASVCVYLEDEMNLLYRQMLILVACT